MRDETKIGVVLGLNIAVERLFKKVWDTMHAEVISQHDALPALSDDIDAISELLEKQRKYIEEIGADPVKKAHQTVAEYRCAEVEDENKSPDNLKKD